MNLALVSIHLNKVHYLLSVADSSVCEKVDVSRQSGIRRLSEDTLHGLVDFGSTHVSIEIRYMVNCLLECFFVVGHALLE